MTKKDDNGEIALGGLREVDRETHPNWEAEIMRQLDNVETLPRIGIDYKAVVPDDRVKENDLERTKGRLTFQG